MNYTQCCVTITAVYSQDFSAPETKTGHIEQPLPIPPSSSPCNHCSLPVSGFVCSRSSSRWRHTLLVLLCVCLIAFSITSSKFITS